MEEMTGQTRVIIEGLRPEIDGGRFPIKRVMGEKVVVEADIFVDGYDSISEARLNKKVPGRTRSLS
jgi:starch synthase (maltosyl-transferring)